MIAQLLDCADAPSIWDRITDYFGVHYLFPLSRFGSALEMSAGLSNPDSGKVISVSCRRASHSRNRMMAAKYKFANFYVCVAPKVVP